MLSVVVFLLLEFCNRWWWCQHLLIKTETEFLFLVMNASLRLQLFIALVFSEVKSLKFDSKKWSQDMNSSVLIHKKKIN